MRKKSRNSVPGLRKQRMAHIETLMASGMSGREVCRVLAPEYECSEVAIRNDVRKLRGMWGEYAQDESPEDRRNHLREIAHVALRGAVAAGDPRGGAQVLQFLADLDHLRQPTQQIAVIGQEAVDVLADYYGLSPAPELSDAQRLELPPHTARKGDQR